MPDVARKCHEGNCKPAFDKIRRANIKSTAEDYELSQEPGGPPRFTELILGVFLLLQTAGKSIHWMVVDGLPGAAGPLLPPSL
jgi:hypothetical protein